MIKLQENDRYIQTIKIDDDQLKKILALRNCNLDPGKSGRELKRYNYHRTGCIVELKQPGDCLTKNFLSPTLNLSGSGMSILHGGFVHTGSFARVLLTSISREEIFVTGMVVRCKYLFGKIHELGIRFHNEIDVSGFSSEATRWKVLLVEDDDSTARLAIKHLESMNVEVTHALDGLSALQLANENHFDLIFMDIILPDITGFDVTKQILANGYSGRIAAVTSLSEDSIYEKCLKAGCDLFVPKPFTVQSLQDVIRSIQHTPIVSNFHSDPYQRGFLRDFISRQDNAISKIQLSIKNSDMNSLVKYLTILEYQSSYYGFDQIKSLTEQIKRKLKTYKNTNLIVDDTNQLFGYLSNAKSSLVKNAVV